MAGSPSEQYREVTNALGRLTERVDQVREDGQDLWAENERLGVQLQAVRDEAGRLREESAQTRRLLDEARATIREAERANADLRQEIALVRQRQDDQQKRSDEWGRRAWAIVILLLGAVLSLASGLIVTLARK